MLVRVLLWSWVKSARETKIRAVRLSLNVLVDLPKRLGMLGSTFPDSRVHQLDQVEVVLPLELGLHLLHFVLATEPRTHAALQRCSSQLRGE